MFADTVVIETRVVEASPFRAVFDQRAIRASDETLLVEGHLELVCVNRDKKLVQLPAVVRERIRG